MEVISRPLLNKTRHHEAQRSARSLYDSARRVGSSLPLSVPLSMAQQIYALGSGPSRPGQHDDRGAAQGRQNYDGLAVTAPQAETFTRSAQYVENSPLFTAPVSSYDHTGAGLRAVGPSPSMINMHNQQQSDSQASGPYGDAFAHQQTHYPHYPQPSAHVGQSSQPYQHQHHHQQQHQQHLQHPSEQQQMGMQMPGDMMSSQSSAMHHPHATYGMHPHSSQHPDYSQGSVDAQRKAENRAEQPEPHTPRPPNAWILYRSQKFREIQQNRDSQTRSGSSDKPKSQAEISRIISQMWQNETTAVKQRFEALADEKKLAHQRMYPTYRYRPKKKAKNSKQTAASQANDQSQGAEGHGIKKEPYGSYPGSYQDRTGPAGNTSPGYAHDRKGGNDLQRSMGGPGSSTIHDLAGRDLMPRKSFADRRENNYGRSVSGSVSSGDSQGLSSYSSNRMHPYGERPSSLLRQESPRASDVFGEPPSTSSTYSSGHWGEQDALGGPSSNAYFDGSRGGPSSYALGGTRLPPSSMIGSNALGGASILSLSPPQRQSVPSQQLQQPLDHIEGGNPLDLADLAGAGGGAVYGNGGGSFRTTPVTSHAARFGSPNFGGGRPEVPSGLAVPGSNDGLSEPLDPHRRI